MALVVTGCAATPPQTGPDLSQASMASEEVDPPGRVGVLSLAEGSVYLTDMRSRETQTATVNWPITSGFHLATGEQSRAEVRIGSVAMRLGSQTEVTFSRIDDDAIHLTVHQGSLAVRLRNRTLLNELAIEAGTAIPAHIQFDDVGRYRIDVNYVPGVAALTAFVGHAQATTPTARQAVASGQRVEWSASTRRFRTVNPATDVFDDWVDRRDAQDDTARRTQSVSDETTGIEYLTAYGRWQSTSPYGWIWIPAHVPTGWAPYRFGHWAWIAPWGWTWIDDAPWGFAPFHYGRWVMVGGRWCWAPGHWTTRPVYAPALVVWLSAPGVSIQMSSGDPVGWFPLGWGEPYLPPHRHSHRYIRSINSPYLPHQGARITPPAHYVHENHRDRISWAPAHRIEQSKEKKPGTRNQAPEGIVRGRPVTRAPTIIDDEQRMQPLPRANETQPRNHPTPQRPSDPPGAILKRAQPLQDERFNHIPPAAPPARTVPQNESGLLRLKPQVREITPPPKASPNARTPFQKEGEMR